MADNPPPQCPICNDTDCVCNPMEDGFVREWQWREGHPRNEAEHESQQLSCTELNTLTSTLLAYPLTHHVGLPYSSPQSGHTGSGGPEPQRAHLFSEYLLSLDSIEYVRNNADWVKLHFD